MESFLGLKLKTWIANAVVDAKGKGKSKSSARKMTGTALVFGHLAGGLGASRSRTGNSVKGRLSIETELKKILLPWQVQHVMKSEAEGLHLPGKNGPVWIFRLKSPEEGAQHGGLLEKSSLAKARDSVASIVGGFAHYKDLATLHVQFFGCAEEEENAALLGLEVASYSFAENRVQGARKPKSLPRLILKSEANLLEPKRLQSVANQAWSVNVARHLVNLPPNELNPATYADLLRTHFSKMPNTKVTVLEGKALQDERMNLLLAVGGGAAEGPRMVRISYRPRGFSDVKTSTAKAARMKTSAVKSSTVKSSDAVGRESRQPIAFVGKGITFDSGGLDIKPSSAMRLMKKDMGGSAAVVGFANWVCQEQIDYPIDFYLALAENAVSFGSFRPGDIFQARNGLTVEIGNTDAEGRLVLADVMDYAITREGLDKPNLLIDLATLTGAIKVGLGAEIAGLFTTHDELAEHFESAAQHHGELIWRMPLYQPYRSMLRSHCADINNAGEGGFGGAITAAIFLHAFAGSVPWAHLDIYAWKDSPSGAITEVGGNGQSVQMLIGFLNKILNGDASWIARLSPTKMSAASKASTGSQKGASARKANAKSSGKNISAKSATRK